MHTPSQNNIVAFPDRPAITEDQKRHFVRQWQQRQNYHGHNRRQFRRLWFAWFLLAISLLMLFAYTATGKS